MEGGLHVFGVRLLGFTPHTAHKLLLTVAFVAAILVVRWALVGVVWLVRGRTNERIVFWTRQISSLVTALLTFLAVLSIWFDEPGRLATGMGLFTAGLAFALQKVITAFAGYVVIMRGNTFAIGDRIKIGEVRGDVIAVGFIQTKIMEMGEPPPVQSEAPAVWVRARQYTGRIVSVSNADIFDEPVYNFSRDFPFMWEEIMVPVSYEDDRARAEEILLECARKHGVDPATIPESVRETMQRKYFLRMDDVVPRVYWRITDNWVELTVRFIVEVHGVRDVKDAMAREILAGFDAAKIGIASSTYDVVGLPPLKLDVASARRLRAALDDDRRSRPDDDRRASSH